MGVRIKISGALAGQATPIDSEYSEGDLKEILLSLQKRFPLLHNKLIDSTGKVKTFVGVYINGLPIEKSLDDTVVVDNDEILIIGSVAGG